MDLSGLAHGGQTPHDYIIAFPFDLTSTFNILAKRLYLRAGSKSVMDIDKEISVNSLIREYLVFANYSKTIDIFDAECGDKGRPVDASDGGGVESTLEEAENRFLISFRNGDRAAFFALWDDQFPSSVRASDPLYQKLEFLLSVYFAVFPIHPGVSATAAKHHSLPVTMDTFKQFLETRGAELCKTTQFLSYYALPYVPDPRMHPSFKDIFEHAWVADLEERLKQFLRSALRGSIRPRLVKVVEESHDSGKTFHEQSQEAQAIRKQLGDLEEREFALSSKHRTLQNDYHNLITIASELVQTLTACINGQKITPAYLSGVCQRLASFKQNQGKASDGQKDARKISPQAQSSTSTINNHAALAAEPKPSEHQPRTTVEPEIPLEQYLDYNAIARDLTPTTDPRVHKQQAFLLQALRLHVTKSQSIANRRTILMTYTANDFFQVAAGKSFILDLFDHPSQLVQDQTARLINILASDCSGREYLSRNSHLVPKLVECMKAEEIDSVFRQNVLGILQKLSLRRVAQSAMNSVMVIPYLLELLQDLDGLSEYTIQYGTALLMNLCLRTAGKRQCATNPERTLKMLTALMDHDNLQVKTYVNGTLYSLFTEPSIRDAARAMGMEDMLQYLRSSSDEQLVRQIDFVTEQLNSEEVPDNSDTVSEDGEEEDFEDDEEDIPEEDDTDDLPPPTPSNPTGTSLLLKYKLATPRPITTRPYDSLPHHPLSHPSSLNLTPHDLLRPRTPSRPGTPTVYKSMTSLPLQRAPAALREDGGAKGLVGSGSTSHLRQSTNSVTGSSNKLNKARGSKDKSRDLRHPITVEEQQEIDLAFSTRPKLPRTPLPGASSSRNFSVTASLSALSDDVHQSANYRRMNVDGGVRSSYDDVRATSRLSQTSGR
ncbi:uncharacterized protein SPPG_02969 [Spizellomyces punctatus DAOM BR117]|uniref:LisH domain-containing protein ARMC9 n=1 Tax=Spizellomyces punctatus (strain DAOM BR117) TaxID=645134 RepID=A0A0L0HM45_SPIPD|nr:uncharacterized protein SPPG_02969 [Spizellomyces punctatus DAOM BR117]KND02511.1 hypothetical protein SPPG_02969 [Spizellomyces punctatus DAOM BR117]|eukprot:XP_016610550.1 hypothetical protein SPPG_02969 [Spizellomyces punctatus DAOM BR117]